MHWSGGTGPGWYQGGVYGWVYRVGNTGSPSQVPRLLEEVPRTSEAGPGSPRGWSGWVLGAGRTGDRPVRAQPLYHHSLRSGPLQAPAGPSAVQGLPRGQKGEIQ